MKEILHESELPKWVVGELNKEREYWATYPGYGIVWPTTLGTTDCRIYHIKDDWYMWERGRFGKLVSDGRKIYITSFDPETESDCDTEVFIGWIGVHYLQMYMDRIYDGLTTDTWPPESIKEIYALLQEEGLLNKN